MNLNTFKYQILRFFLPYFLYNCECSLGNFTYFHLLHSQFLQSIISETQGNFITTTYIFVIIATTVLNVYIRRYCFSFPFCFPVCSELIKIWKNWDAGRSTNQPLKLGLHLVSTKKWLDKPVTVLRNINN